MNTIYFVTSNKRKHTDFAARLKHSEWSLIHHNAELNELQSLDGIAITRYKLDQVKKLLPDKKVIVEDRGLFIPALKGFPGTFLKLILKSIGIDGILRLMKDKKDRTAKFISILGYFDGKKEHYFVDEEIGFLAKRKNGLNMHGWTELLYIYGHNSFPHKTLAELTDEQWNRYMYTITQNDYINQFIRFLQTAS